MPKIDRAHKNYLTPKIREEMHLREIFDFSTLYWPPWHAKTTFCLYLVKCLIVMFRCAINATTSSFQNFTSFFFLFFST